MLNFSNLSFAYPDVNECTDGTHNCDSNAACTNTNGAFTCSCNSGYIGDGTSCSGNKDTNLFLLISSFNS